MKKIIFSLCVALLMTISSSAQQISVVSPNGTTTVFRTLQESIEGADPGSVIYLPGGEFSISDEVKITKKLTIIGIGYYVNNGNADGITIINGNLWFNEGSSGSAVMGCYISGNVNIGEDAAVYDFTIEHCNFNSLQVKNSGCTGTFINQNYVRSESNFGNSEVTIKNNIINKMSNVASGVITNNVCCHSCGGAARYNQYYRSLDNVNNSTIVGNIFRGGDLAWFSYFYSGNSCTFSKNLLMGSQVGDDPVLINASANDIFVNANGWSISPTSDFHFKDDYKQYENQVGIYAGTGFNNQVTSVPYIIFKDVPTETDAQGMLKVRIRVKANQ